MILGQQEVKSSEYLDSRHSKEVMQTHTHSHTHSHTHTLTHTHSLTHTDTLTHTH